MSFWVYILRCADGSYYTGHTDNLEKRIHEHHAGMITSCYTFKRRPLQLAFSQDFPTRIEALTSEQQIKGWSRKKKEAMMRGDWAEVSRLAKSSNTCRADNTVQAELLDDDCPESSDAVRPEPKAVSRELVEWSNGRTGEGTNGVEKRQATPIRSEISSTDQSEPFYAVRPELVEGTNRAQDKPIEGSESSIHPSTSSGRTDGERSL